MSYFEAFQIGWSMLWRQLAWTAAGFTLVAAFYKTQHSLAWTIRLAAATAALLFLVIFPRIIRHIPTIEYSGFRLVVHRSDDRPPRLAWLECLVLLLAIYLVNAFVASPLKWLLTQTYQFFILAFYPFVVAMPLSAYILVGFPSNRFQLEVLPLGLPDVPELHLYE